MNLDSMREWKERIVEEKSIETEQRIERYLSSVNSVRELQQVRTVFWIVSQKEDSLKQTVEDHVVSLTSYSDPQSVGFGQKVVLKESVDLMVVC